MLLVDILYKYCNCRCVFQYLDVFTYNLSLYDRCCNIPIRKFTSCDINMIHNTMIRLKSIDIFMEETTPINQDISGI